MKKVIKPVIVFAAALLLILLNEFTGFADKKILVEETAPVYTQYLNYKKGKRYQIDKRIDGFDTVNYLINNSYPVTSNGIERSVGRDGSITLNGTAEEKTYFSVSVSEWKLPDGHYAVLDNGKKPESTKGVLLYVQGIRVLADNELQKTTLARTHKNNTFTADSRKYDHYRLILRIDEGTVLEDLTFRITVADADKQTKKNIPSLLVNRNTLRFKRDYQILVFEMPYSEFEKMRYEDIRVFFNNLKYIYASDYNRALIRFDDGKALEFAGCDPASGIFGDLDYNGHVKEEGRLQVTDGEIRIEPSDPSD